jgi:N-acetylglucosaminyldiphosphoundecaprenol N-acetyl-beta-D-mannosaminyltransferase
MNLKKYLNQLSSLFADGIGVYWASKFLYGNNGLWERINGTDLYYKILDMAENKSYSIFFFGGSEKAANSLESQIRKIYPNLVIKGILPKNLNTTEKILNEINSSKSDILFLGLGTPYKEKWIATFGQKCNIPIQIAVGSGIDFVAGTYKRAPKLMRLLGLEWLFRLFLEPKRLWKRYLIGIPHFIFLIIKQKFLSEKYRD